MKINKVSWMLKLFWGWRVYLYIYHRKKKIIIRGGTFDNYCQAKGENKIK